MSDHSVRFERSPSALWRRAGAEIVVSLPDDEETRLLSGSAASVWMLLDAPRTLPDLVSDLAAAYGVENEEIEAPVGDCVDQLLALGVAEEVADA